jgi:hypothetical protein
LQLLCDPPGRLKQNLTTFTTLVITSLPVTVTGLLCTSLTSSLDWEKYTQRNKRREEGRLKGKAAREGWK